eukprot:gene9048-9985_t
MLSISHSSTYSSSSSSSIRNAYDIRKSISSLAFHHEQRFAALGSTGETKIIKIDLNGNISEMTSYTNTTSRGNVNDLAWNSESVNPTLAIAYGSGEIRCGTLASTTSLLEIKWNVKYEDSSNNLNINTVTWHPSDINLLASLDNKGSIRLFDLRASVQPGACPIPSGSARSLSTNSSKLGGDLQFNPFHQDIFAVALEGSAVVRLWDRRSLRTFLSETSTNKEVGHIGGVATIAWSATHESVLATGSVDKMVKVWDTSPSAGGEPLLLHTLHATGELIKVRWIGDNNHTEFLTMTTKDSPLVSIWDLQRTNVPVCVLRGHSDTCASFQWIYCHEACPIKLASEEPPKLVIPSKARNKKSKQQRDNSQELFLPRFLLSVGKDSQVLIQDPRLGDFPNDQLAPCVTALSSQGHAAYHYSAPLPPISSNLFKDPCVAPSPSNSEKVMKMSYVGAVKSTPPRALSTVTKGRIVLGHAQLGSLEQVCSVRTIRANAEASVFDPALIYLLAEHYCLPYRLSRRNHQATGTQIADFAFDQSALTDALEVGSTMSEAPSLSRMPVSRRSVSTYGHDARAMNEDEALHSFRTALAVCEHNMRVARRAGLHSRAVVWTTLLALIPGQETTSSSLCGADKLSFALDILCQLLKDLLEAGDSQHFVLVCEIYRKVGLLNPLMDKAQLSITSMRRIYLAYLDLLMKAQLYCKACDIINGLDDNQLIVSLQKGVDYTMRCSRCKKELPKRDNKSCRNATVWCETCKACASICSICQEPVVGLMQWCPVCTHGGHLDCLLQWFRQCRVCPLGCGHFCCPQPPALHEASNRDISTTQYDQSYRERMKTASERMKGRRGYQVAKQINSRIRTIAAARLSKGSCEQVVAK